VDAAARRTNGCSIHLKSIPGFEAQHPVSRSTSMQDHRFIAVIADEIDFVYSGR